MSNGGTGTLKVKKVLGFIIIIINDTWKSLINKALIILAMHVFYLIWKIYLSQIKKKLKTKYELK